MLVSKKILSIHFLYLLTYVNNSHFFSKAFICSLIKLFLYTIFAYNYSLYVVDLSRGSGLKLRISYNLSKLGPFGFIFLRSCTLFSVANSCTINFLLTMLYNFTSVFFTISTESVFLRIELSQLGDLSFYIILDLVIETKFSVFLGKKGVILLF